VPEITTRSDGTLTTLVVVTGEVLDPPDASQLYEAVCDAVRHQVKSVEIDLAGVELFGSPRHHPTQASSSPRSLAAMIPAIPNEHLRCRCGAADAEDYLTR